MQTPRNTRGQSCLQIQMPHEAPEQRAGVPASWTPSCSRLPPTFAAQPPSRGRCLQPRSSSSFISSPAQGVSAGAPAVNDFLRSLLRSHPPATPTGASPCQPGRNWDPRPSTWLFVGILTSLGLPAPLAAWETSTQHVKNISEDFYLRPISSFSKPTLFLGAEKHEKPFSLVMNEQFPKPALHFRTKT